VRQFVFEDVVDAFQQRLGYQLVDRTRRRMVKVIIDLLCECGCLKNKDGLYLWNGIRDDITGLRGENVEKHN